MTSRKLCAAVLATLFVCAVTLAAAQDQSTTTTTTQNPPPAQTQSTTTTTSQDEPATQTTQHTHTTTKSKHHHKKVKQQTDTTSTTTTPAPQTHTDPRKGRNYRGCPVLLSAFCADTRFYPYQVAPSASAPSTATQFPPLLQSQKALEWRLSAKSKGGSLPDAEVRGAAGRF
jgi:hypothetical protein